MYYQDSEFEYSVKKEVSLKGNDLDCGKSKLSNKGNMNTHKRIHTGDKPFKCEICEEAFISKFNLKRHRVVHTGEKLFECEICGKTFTMKDNLDKHRLIHTGEKPFACE